MMRLSGVHCVLFAFFGADGALDEAAMRRQIARIRAEGADGITVLGLATEVGKLTVDEQRRIVTLAAREAGDLPLWVTIAGESVATQRAMLDHAAGSGAALAILQPPAEEGDANALLDFFAEVGADAPLPLAVQNAPAFLGRSLSGSDLGTLRARLPGLAAVKAEMPAADLAGFIAAAGADLAVLAGRGGLEMTDSLRAGATGFVVAPDVLPGVRACLDAWLAGDEAGAEAAYARLLPGAVFAMQSLDHLALYGKRIFAARAGLSVHDRPPTPGPTTFGLTLAARHGTEREVGESDAALRI